MPTQNSRQGRRNVFLLGYDEFHARYLERLPGAETVEFHPLLQSDELVYQHEYRLEDLLNRARRALDEFDGPVDGIITHWDFPTMPMLAILCEERGLPGPSLAAVLKCSHKYWSRLEQHAAAPRCTPDFCAVDPFDRDAAKHLTVDYPFWIKPVTAYSSALGFLVEGETDLERALKEAREQIGRIGEPVDDLLSRLEPPPEVAEVGGKQMIAEALIGGREIAPEGHVHNGQVRVHGLVDVVRDANGKSIERVVYPSKIPDEIQRRTRNVTEIVLRQIGFDNACFNVEFFWDEERDTLRIVEINPRMSQSHSNLFEKVDGTSNHAVAVQLALGQRPDFHHGGGPYDRAAKIWWRHYGSREQRVIRAPGEEDLAALAQRQPDTRVEIEVNEGQQLSELLDQDAYGYVLAELHIGARSDEELDAKYREARELLPFELSEAS